MVPILQPEHRFVCPSCGLMDTTSQQGTRMHPCPALAGLTVPLLPAGQAGAHRVNNREDYVGRELVQTDADGRVVASVTTRRDDGEDLTVYAPTALGGAE